MRRRWTPAVLGLGSSLGDRRAALRFAVAALGADPQVRALRASRVYRTRPVGAARGRFENAAGYLETCHSPRGLLARCKAIERRAGRRPSVRWGDRRLDVDVLLFGSVVRSGPGLALPHPGLLGRRFALLPAVEVAGHLRHPVAGCRLGECPVPPGPPPGVPPYGPEWRLARQRQQNQQTAANACAICTNFHIRKCRREHLRGRPCDICGEEG